MLAEATVDDGVIMLDDTGFAKPGRASVGVARQYTRTPGKVCYCQVVVTCCYTDPWATWPIAARLYLPQNRAEYPKRCLGARLPAEVGFEAKPAIALRLLD
jgi:SRSO17 transposase